MHRHSFLIAPVLILLLILTGCVPAIPEYMIASSGIGSTSQSVEAPGSDSPDNQESLHADASLDENEDSSLPEPDNMQSSADQTSIDSENELTPDNQASPESENGQVSGNQTSRESDNEQVPDNQASRESDNGSLSGEQTRQEPIGTVADGSEIPQSSPPDKRNTTADNSVIILSCPVINAVSDHPGWYQSMIGDIYILLFGQTDELQNYLGKPATVLGKVVAENMGMENLHKHLPVEVYGLDESSGNYDCKPISESVSLIGMMELNASGNLVLHSTERGDVFIQTDPSDFGEVNFLYPANFTGYLFPIIDPGCPYLLIATSYSIMDFPDVSNIQAPPE
jgi:hypothetical protein